MLQVVTSNRMEVLADRLGEILMKAPTGDPMEPETVVLPSRGMETWLSMHLAQRLGVVANVRFPFPGREIRRLLQVALRRGEESPSDLEWDDPWDPDRLTWAILEELPAHASDPQWAPLTGYLREGSAGDLPKGTIRPREWALARRIATLFDSYANDRPDWVRDWSEAMRQGRPPSRPDLEEGDRWQPLLWGAVERRLGVPHPLSRLPEALSVLRNDQVPLRGLPRRVFLFGFSALPPVYLDVLEALATRMEVSLLALTPVRGYFGHVRTLREQARLREASGMASVEELHLGGPALIQSLGRISRDFNEVLADRLAEEPEDCCLDPLEDEGRTSMLAQLQGDLLDLREVGGPGPAALSPREVPEPDDSLQFHVCHGSLRQVEVLRDQLLHLFQRHPDLDPRDVVVMCPDVDAFAPLIDAVFSETSGQRAVDRESGLPHLPFSIADQDPRTLNPLREVLTRVLDLCGGRVRASEVLDLLSLEPVRARFCLTEEDLKRIQQWVGEAGARWGVDEDHRAAEDQPRFRQNTWRFALDRLLLGVAMPSTAGSLEDPVSRQSLEERPRVFAGVLPQDGIEGDDARVLGRFLQYCETLFEARRRLERRERVLSLEEWRDFAVEVLGSLVRLSEPELPWQREVLHGLAGLVEDAQRVDHTRSLSLETFRQTLDEVIRARGRTGLLFRGGITFCAMVPMRAIPFRVVCLLGMDNQAFPRPSHPAGFDLVARRPRLGDRGPRDEDRHLFLEALLSARDALLILWNGRSLRDNTPLPPAVPVSELLDHFDRSFRLPADTDDLRRHLVQEHPLQAFSPRAFRPRREEGGPRWPSFDLRSLQASEALRSSRAAPWRFFDRACLPDPPEWGITPDHLASFLRHPVRHLFQRRLGIFLDPPREPIEDREPVDLDAREQGALGNEVLQARLRGLRLEDIRQRMLLQGRLQPGNLGRWQLEVLSARVEEVLMQFQKVEETGEPRPHWVDLRVGPVRIQGTLQDIRPSLRESGSLLCFVQYRTISPTSLLTAWVHHLLAWQTVPDFLGRTLLVGGPGSRSSEVLQFGGGNPEDREEARARAWKDLQDLVDLYRTGWSRPLLFLPRSSYKYMEHLQRKDGEEEKARRAASEAHQSGNVRTAPGEDGDPYWASVLEGRDPWDEETIWPPFVSSDDLRPEALARKVWSPILAAMTTPSRWKATE